MDYPGQFAGCSSVNRKLEAISEWVLDKADVPCENGLSSCTSLNVWEPCSFQDQLVMLPLELFTLKAEEIATHIFNFEVWQNLSPENKGELNKYLPNTSDPTESDSIVKWIFSRENVKFGNPVYQFIKKLLSGEYHLMISRLKNKIREVEKKLHHLSMKSYHIRLIRFVLEYKRKIGLRVDDNLLNFFRQLPSDTDKEAFRYLSRARNRLLMRVRRRHSGIQLSELIGQISNVISNLEQELLKISRLKSSSSTEDMPSIDGWMADSLSPDSLNPDPISYQISSLLKNPLLSNSLSTAHNLSGYSWISCPTLLSDDIYIHLEDELDDDDSDIASLQNISCDQLSNMDNFLLMNDEDGLIDDKKLLKQNLLLKNKKRKREELNEADSTMMMSLTSKKKREKRKERRKMLPVLPFEEVFSLFPTIKREMEKHAPSPVSFETLYHAIEKEPKLMAQIPVGYDLTQVLVFALNILQKPPADFVQMSNNGTVANSKGGSSQAEAHSQDFKNEDKNIASKQALNSASFSNQSSSSPLSPFVVEVDPGASGSTLSGMSSDHTHASTSSTLTSGISSPFLFNSVKDKLYAWNLPSSNLLADRLEQLEIIFFFSLTRNQLSPDHLELEFNMSKQMKAPQTLEPIPEHVSKEFREQELVRFANAEFPFVYHFSNPPKGHSSKVIAPPLRNQVSTLRPNTSLRTDRPAFVSLLALVRDALSRLPGGVGTRPDVTLLLKDSQYVLDNVEATQLNSVVSGGLDRLHSEYDPCVRFDNDLKLWINLHRQRNEQDHIRMKDIEEKSKLLDFGHSSSASSSIASPPSDPVSSKSSQPVNYKQSSYLHSHNSGPKAGKQSSSSSEQQKDGNVSYSCVLSERYTTTEDGKNSSSYLRNALADPDITKSTPYEGFHDDDEIKS